MPVTGAGIPTTTLRMVLIALRACRLSEAVKAPDHTPYLANRKSHPANREIPLTAGAFRGMVRRKRGEEGGDGRRVTVFVLHRIALAQEQVPPRRPHRPSPCIPSPLRA